MHLCGLSLQLSSQFFMSSIQTFLCAVAERSHNDVLMYCVHVGSCDHLDLGNVLWDMDSRACTLQLCLRCLGNILDGWGTFWTKISVVLSPCEVCRKLCIFYTFFKGKIWNFVTKISSYDSLMVQIFVI